MRRTAPRYSRWRTRFHFSAKAHITVRYGASLFERRTGPIEIGSTYLIPYSDQVIYGADGLVEPVTASRFLLRFEPAADPPPSFAVLIQRSDGAPLAYGFGISVEEITRVAGAPILGLSQSFPLVPENLRASINFISLEDSAPRNRDFSMELPPEFGPITSVHLIFDTANRKAVVLDFAGLVDRKAPANIISVATKVPRFSLQPVLEISDEHRHRNTVYPDTRGVYRFSRPQSGVFSMVFRSAYGVYYLPGRQVAFICTGAGRDHRRV